MNTRTLFELRKIAVCAVLAAAGIVLGKLLAVNIGQSFRLSFENLPVLFAGLYLGPWYGLFCGAAADLVGSVMVGYAINPVITLGAASIGLCAGLAGVFFKGRSYRTPLAVIIAHSVGSIVIKTAGIVLFYSAPLWITLLWRILIYLVTGTLECLLLMLLEKNTAFQKQLAKLLSV